MLWKSLPNWRLFVQNQQWEHQTEWNLFKVNDKYKKTTLLTSFFCLNFNFEQILHIFLVFPLLTLSKEILTELEAFITFILVLTLSNVSL